MAQMLAQQHQNQNFHPRPNQQQMWQQQQQQQQSPMMYQSGQPSQPAQYARMQQYFQQMMMQNQNKIPQQHPNQVFYISIFVTNLKLNCLDYLFYILQVNEIDKIRNNILKLLKLK